MTKKNDWEHCLVFMNSYTMVNYEPETDNLLWFKTQLHEKLNDYIWLSSKRCQGPYVANYQMNHMNQGLQIQTEPTIGYWSEQ